MPTVLPSPEVSAPPQSEGLEDPATKERAEQIISTFENSTTTIQYDYAENLDDGRGITAGRAGFTSGTDDLLEVVKLYEKTTQNPNNALKGYLPALEKVDGTDSTKGLGGFIKAWERTSHDDPALNAAQDTVYDELYFNPAMQHAKELGLHSAIAQLAVVDTDVQHGDSDNPSDPEYEDSLTALLDKAGPVVNGDEEAWTTKFLGIRKNDLLHPHNAETADDWRDSVDRVNALMSLVKTNPNLQAPVVWTVYGDSFTLVKKPQTK